MPFTDLKMRFVSEYKGDIKDPILTTLLQALDTYQKDIQDQLMLSIYSQRSDQISDGLFEVLRRHLFGQMFPGPVYAVTHATLRDAATAGPVLLEQHHYLSLQDLEGDKVLFAPEVPTWIVPSQTNDVQIQVFGDDLMLGFTISVENLGAVPEGVARIYAHGVDPLLVERLRCRLPQHLDGGSGSSPVSSVLRPQYPGIFTLVDNFFRTPYATRFLEVPFDLLENVARREDVVWLPFQGLGEFGPELERKLTLNAFLVWNMVVGEMLAIQTEGTRYKVPVASQGAQQTVLATVEDLGFDPPVEYADASVVADPGYPFQYTSSVDASRDDIYLTVSPLPAGDLKVRYYQYDVSDRCENIAEGRSFSLYKGIDERVKSAQLLTPTHRLETMRDKQRIWNYFRSLLASRNRWLTRDDLRAAVVTFPAFAARRNMVVREKIRFQERVGRMPKGFLTPYTEILVPLRDRALLQDPDRTYFEHQLEEYIKGRAVHGSFVRVKFASADDV